MTLENGIMMLIVLLLNIGTFYLLLRDDGLCELDDQQKPRVSRKALWIYGCIFVLLNMAIAVFFTYMYETNTLVFSLKRFCVLALLWPVGLIDLKTYRIPNRFVLTGLVLRAMLILPELLLEMDYFWGTLVSELVAAAALGLAAFLCSVCLKNSIGFGDIKLLLVMGLLLGMSGIWSAIFMSLIVAFFGVLFLLIAKKKNKNDVVPFAPAIMIGTYLSIILTGM